MLLQSLDPGLPVWLLVDPLLGEPLPTATAAGVDLGQARQAAWNRPVHALPLEGYALAPAQQPYLVALDGVDDTWLAQSVHLAASELDVLRAGGIAGDGRGALAVGGWLQAACGVAEVSVALTALMTLRQRHPGGVRHLRLADPRTRDWLDVVLGRSTWSRAFGPIRRWAWLDSCGRFVQAEAQFEGQQAAALEFTPSQWERFSLAPLVHPALARWQAALGAERSLSDTTQALQRVAGEVLNAQKASKAHPRHLNTADDLIAHTVLALLHPGLYQAPAFLSWLADDPLSDHFEPLRDHFATLQAALGHPAAADTP